MFFMINLRDIFSLVFNCIVVSDFFFSGNIFSSLDWFVFQNAFFIRNIFDSGFSSGGLLDWLLIDWNGLNWYLLNLYLLNWLSIDWDLLNCLLINGLNLRISWLISLLSISWLKSWLISWLISWLSVSRNDLRGCCWESHFFYWKIWILK